MSTMDLSGHFVLVVEDEPIIALDVASSFEAAGASVTIASTLGEANRLVEAKRLSLVVLDFGLNTNDGSAGLCARLDDRNIPFIVHSGYSQNGPLGHCGVVIPKPADPAYLVECASDLLRP